MKYVNLRMAMDYDDCTLFVVNHIKRELLHTHMFASCVSEKLYHEYVTFAFFFFVIFPPFGIDWLITFVVYCLGLSYIFVKVNIEIENDLLRMLSVWGFDNRKFFYLSTLYFLYKFCFDFIWVHFFYIE